MSELDSEIERVCLLAQKYGLDLDDQTADELAGEWIKQTESVQRRESSADPAQAAVEKVAGKHQAQIRLDAIRELYKREPTPGELFKAAYRPAEPVKGPVQKPGPDASPVELFTYYYRHLAPKE
jgi:hypothetical protein